MIRPVPAEVLKPVALGECPQARPYGLPTPAGWERVAERLRSRRPERRSSSIRAVHRARGCARQAGAACAAPGLGFVPSGLAPSLQAFRRRWAPLVLTGLVSWVGRCA